MALANSAWADYPTKRVSWSRPARRRSTFGSMANAAFLAACATAAIAIFHPAQLADSIAPIGPSASLEALRTALPGEAARLLLERHVESFLADSLALAGDCEADCARIDTEVAEAGKLGRFGSSTALPAQAPLPTGLPIGARFAPHVEAAPAMPPAPAPNAAPAQPAVATVRVTPSIVVPLAPPTPGHAAAPIPAPRVSRPADTATTLAMPAEPMAEAHVPLGGRTPLPVAAPPAAGNSGVAVYDISAATVYMPDGARLEAHSGLGRMVDNPRFVDRKNTGPTPPGAYDLVMRKGRFHGVEALRLVPVDSKTRYGRDGLLTHTYLLRGRPGQSNGCVVFPNYASFLNAFKRGHVRRLVVVPSLKGAPAQVASAGR